MKQLSTTARRAFARARRHHEPDDARLLGVRERVLAAVSAAPGAALPSEHDVSPRIRWTVAPVRPQAGVAKGRRLVLIAGGALVLAALGTRFVPVPVAMVSSQPEGPRALEKLEPSRRSPDAVVEAAEPSPVARASHAQTAHAPVAETAVAHARAGGERQESTSELTVPRTSNARNEGRVDSPPGAPPVPALASVSGAVVERLASDRAALSSAEHRGRKAPRTIPLDTLGVEARLLTVARTALAAGDVPAARVALNQHRASFPAGQLSIERAALEVWARCQTNDRTGARAAWQELTLRSPAPGLLRRIRAACAAVLE